MRRQEGNPDNNAHRVCFSGSALSWRFSQQFHQGSNRVRLVKNALLNFYLADGGVEQAIFWIKNPTVVTVARCLLSLTPSQLAVNDLQQYQI